MNGDNPLVSVIIPLYNAEKYIEETIKSVINQTYKNWELIVVDDCSTDNSREIVKSFEIDDNRIRLIESETNFGGPARPRNIGIDNSKGDYIAFLDADDVWMDNKLEVQISFMLYNKLNFSATLMLEFNENGIIKIKYKLIKKLLHKIRKYSLCRLSGNNFIFLSTTIIKKNHIELFTEEKEFIAVEDYCLWLQLFNNNETSFGMLKEVLLKYRVVSDSISERNNLYKQNTKAKLCVFNFIHNYKKYDIYKCAIATKVENIVYSITR